MSEHILEGNFMVKHILEEYQFLLQKNVWGSIKTLVWILEEKIKRREMENGRKGLQTLFLVCVHANGCDNSSAASAVFAV